MYYLYIYTIPVSVLRFISKLVVVYLYVLYTSVVHIHALAIYIYIRSRRHLSVESLELMEKN